MAFEKELETLINRYSQEGASNTPDFILAQFLLSCLAAWNTGVQQRETWYGRDASPSSTASDDKEPPPKVGRPCMKPFSTWTNQQPPGQGAKIRDEICLIRCKPGTTLGRQSIRYRITLLPSLHLRGLFRCRVDGGK